MILYRLRCENGHALEAWFGSIKSYDAQAAAGQIACPDCGSCRIEKAPMAPAIGKGRHEAGSSGHGTETDAGEGHGGEETGGRGLSGQAPADGLAALRALRAKLTEGAENVGDAFPQEARRIHDGGSKERPIYGRASPSEARDLAEDGIPVLPLPRLPEDQN